jgi:hypothetical protein
MADNATDVRENSETNLAARPRKPNNNWPYDWLDARTDAYKDMTDISRERIDRIEAKIGGFDNKYRDKEQKPADKRDAAKLLREAAEIYQEESMTATTKEIAKQSQKISELLKERAAKLELNNGHNGNRIMTGDEFKLISLDTNGSPIIASTNGEQLGNKSTNNQKNSTQQVSETNLAFRPLKPGNSWYGSEVDSRSDAYQDMTDVSRRRIDRIEAEIGVLNRGSQTPEDKVDAAALLKRAAAIYNEESNTSTTPEIAQQSRRVAKYLIDYAVKLESNNGNNTYPIPHQNTFKDVALDTNSIPIIASNDDGGVPNTTQANLAKKTIELGRNLIGNRKNDFNSFVEDNIGKVKEKTLEELGKLYLTGYTENPLQEAKDIIIKASEVLNETSTAKQVQNMPG